MKKSELLLLSLLLSCCSSYEEMSIEEDKAFLKLKESDTFYQEYFIQNKKEEPPVHWISTGCRPDKTKVLIFIHGSPGVWSNYLRYLKDPELLKMYCMLGVDRPGFGKSSGVTADVNAQAEKILNTLSKLPEIQKGKKSISLLGHSYGGPVAARMASLFPEKFQYLFLLAAAMDPEMEEIKWYNKIADTWLASRLLPEEWIHSNSEMLPLEEQLKSLIHEWRKIKAKTIVVQGEEDGLVNPQNLDFIRKNFSAETKTYLLPKEGHFLPWKNYELIHKLLIEFSG
ncbi:alpha/beta fold hydrolase [Leptospira licerasiae]|uniref:Alpha/beta hydrolase family protein n=1 Tax=Leptospira licerasiae str. MMD4847 TaxID=1049971 RepID=A0ABP2RDJ3_9LEPT|nr:alpha/beta hydrolase [Leptospira licerasiae]EIE00637.1 alpha/beta hydrolase family protein [Leptospira licerasiae serovar Varillal str. VAR 010]EJZ40433.1 alpha/beta hydrolase family protein [Leptospira licerasiae str. MMD4847]